MPQYMLLIYGEPDDGPAPGEQEEQYAKWLNYTNALVASGAMVAGAPLEGVEAAKTVRVRNGDTVLTEGASQDTKEILGGYYLVDVPDMHAAVALAERMPNIESGTVEVRPVVVFPA